MFAPQAKTVATIVVTVLRQQMPRETKQKRDFKIIKRKWIEKTTSICACWIIPQAWGIIYHCLVFFTRKPLCWGNYHQTVWWIMILESIITIFSEQCDCNLWSAGLNQTQAHLHIGGWWSLLCYKSLSACVNFNMVRTSMKINSSGNQHSE